MAREPNGPPLSGEHLGNVSMRQVVPFIPGSNERHATNIGSKAWAAEEATEDLRKAYVKFLEVTSALLPEIDKFIPRLREQRMAITVEVATFTKSLEDLRKFFIGEDYEKEIKRLGEFVLLCERLKVLKDTGFLDDVADTMLKLHDGVK